MIIIGSDSEKERFVKELIELLTTKLGNRPYFVYEEEIQICYGFKE